MPIINHPKVSLILPIYNMEKFLERCVDSILAQTYDNLEIILVNDGSKDRSDEICKKYASLDQRVIYVSQKNGGICAARNAGLDHASGDYIIFIDPDDYVATNLVSDVIQTFKNSDEKLDMVAYGVHIVKVDREVGQIYWEKSLTTEQILTRMLYVTGWEVWCKAYDRAIWENLRFNDSMRSVEDVYIAADIASKVKHAKALDGLYYYLDRQPHGSLTQTRNSYSYYEEYIAWHHHLDFSVLAPDETSMLNVRTSIGALRALFKDDSDHKLSAGQREELLSFLNEQGYKKEQLTPVLLSYLFYRRAILIKAISGKATTHDEVVNMKSALKLYAVNSVEKQLSEDQENEIYTYIHDTKNLPLKNIYKLLRLAIIHDNRLVKDIVGQLMMKKLSH